MSQAMADRGATVVVLAGRRVDAENSETPRFPLAHVNAVKARIRELFQSVNPEALVCSAACGADLLALDVARALQIPAYIVLPFDRAQFRETSVVDRPGDWGLLYDDVLDDAERAGRLTIMEHTEGDDNDLYLEAVTAMLDKTDDVASRTADGQPAAAPGPVTAVAVWDGQSRGEGDVTEFYINEAKQRGYSFVSIDT